MKQHGRMMISCLLAASLLAGGCESTQKETITAPAASKSQTSAPSGSASRATPGGSQKSRPITGDASGSKSAGGAGGSGSAAKAPAASQDTKKQAASTTPSSAKPTADARQTSKNPEAVKPGSGAKPDPKSTVTMPPPTYAEVAAEYNARTERLSRVWGRAVVSVDFTDEEGNRRWEQGEGHFQVIQPSKMALSAGKLGEVMLWIGCDPNRYWFIDAKESRRAWIGKHSAATRKKIESLGMPAAPRDLLALTGVTPLPKPPSDKRKHPAVRWTENRRSLVFDLERDGALWRYYLNPKTYEPSRIEVVDSASGEPILSATLDNYANVSIRGEGSIPPRMASRMRCLHHASGSTLGLTIADMVDGGSNKLREPNFDFEALKNLLGIRDVVDLDAPRPAARATNDGDLE